jgi:hypothetical protein
MIANSATTQNWKKKEEERERKKYWDRPKFNFIRK